MDKRSPEYPKPSSRHVTSVMKANRKRDTKPEVLLRSDLHRRGYRFRKNYRIALEQLKVNVDIAFPRAKVAVFVDGCFWHRCPIHGTEPRSNTAYWQGKLARNVKRDRQVTTQLEQAGWRVLRIWEHEPVDKASALVANLLES